MRFAAVIVFVLSCTQLAGAADLPRSPDPQSRSATSTSQSAAEGCGAFLDPYCEPRNLDLHRPSDRDVWGIIEMPIYATGTRMAPNGVQFDPLFAVNQSFNLGLMPGKKLYLFADTNFWMQRPGAGITNPSQGKFDFSKREFDVSAGFAWNYYGAWEARISTYALNNLNRGSSLVSPAGFKDGVLLENRYYFGSADKYDIGRLSFLSLGYYPAKSLVGGNGEDFHPGMYARAYVTYDIPFLNSYLYGDAKLTAERVMKPRLLDFEAGIAWRPFTQIRTAEFRLGSHLTSDLQDKVVRDLLYGAVRLNY